MAVARSGTNFLEPRQTALIALRARALLRRGRRASPWPNR